MGTVENKQNTFRNFGHILLHGDTDVKPGLHIS